MKETGRKLGNGRVITKTDGRVTMETDGGQVTMKTDGRVTVTTGEPYTDRYVVGKQRRMGGNEMETTSNDQNGRKWRPNNACGWKW